MDQFAPTTTSEVRTIILKSTNASCDLDPFPTRLLKQCIDDLIVPITAIINLSMREGVVPPDLKQALVTPLIKKKTLCRNEFNNYRPISNLSFLSKILEKIVAKRLNAHIEEHLLSNHVQSAYKRFHSTETALLKIHNDIICNMDNGKVIALALLDLSAAFDTLDHSTLLERLHVHFGISGTVFQWFKSYISGLDIKLVDAVARGASRFENLLAPLKTYWPPQKLTGPFLGYISLRYQCIIVIIHRASCISCHSN